MSRFSGAVVAVISGLLTLAPGASAGLIREVNQFAPHVLSHPLPVSVAGTLGPEVVGPSDPTYTCTVAPADGVEAECSLRAGAASFDDGCGVSAASASFGCHQTGYTVGDAGAYTYRCTLQSGTAVVDVSCTDSWWGLTATGTTCSAWPVTYDEYYASDGSGTTDRTTLSIGDVRIVCDDFPSAQMSCAPAV